MRKNLFSEIKFLGITLEQIIADATKYHIGKCEVIDCSVAVEHNSILGRKYRMVEFRVVFICEGEYMESFPIYRY